MVGILLFKYDKFFLWLFLKLKIEFGVFLLRVGELLFVIVYVMDVVEFFVIGIFVLIVVDIFLFFI